MLREVAAVVEREVGDVAPARDIGGFAAESVTYRAGRGSGYTCGIEGSTVVVRDADYRAWRLPDPARDSLLVLLPADSFPATVTWVASPLLAAPTRGHCRDGSPGLRLALLPDLLARASLSDLPVRVFEWMRIRLYESGGSWWVGARSLRPGDVIQPIAGPLAVRGLVAGLARRRRQSCPSRRGAAAGAEAGRFRTAGGGSRAGARATDTLRATVALRNGGVP